MPKKWIIITVLVIAIGAALVQPIMMTLTKRHSPYEEIAYDQNDLAITVAYCRPYMKDRVIFGELVPFGEVWRTGANEATTIELSQDVTVAGEPLPAGRYALFTIPGENEWTMIFKNKADQWGAFDYDAAEDALRVDVAAEHAESSAPMEQFTIRLDEAENGADLNFAWEKTYVSVPIRLGSGGD